MKRIKNFLVENFHFDPFENLDGLFILRLFLPVRVFSIPLSGDSHDFSICSIFVPN
jgi:hypothetical protein